MPHMGTLQSRTSSPRFETGASSPTPAEGAVTIYWLMPGGIHDLEMLPGTNAGRNLEIPRKANRVVFELCPSIGGAILFKLSQGPVIVEETVTEDASIVFDIVP